MKDKIAIVLSDFNKDITQKMLETALKTAKKQNLKVVQIVHVPGAWEIPYALKQVFEKRKIDGAVMLGVVLQGDTDHDKIVGNNCTTFAMQLSLEYNIPLCSGIIGPRVKYDAAKKKAEEYSTRAVETIAYILKLQI